MYIFQVAPQIAALGERLDTEDALERPLLSVLAKMVTKVAAFAEDRVAAQILATEVDLAALFILKFDDIVPLCRYTFKNFHEVRISRH